VCAAIYYFYREYHQKQISTYNGQYVPPFPFSRLFASPCLLIHNSLHRYDDLLFFYTYMYNLIQKTYKQQNKKFKRIDGWLKE
jgi:hypothetical protein